MVEEKSRSLHYVKIVVDTNVIFSALINPIGTLAGILLYSNESLTFYTPDSTKEELLNHWEKLMRLSKLTGEELDQLSQILMKNIEVIDLDSISEVSWMKAIQLVKNVDLFDTPFVALTLELQGILWTGDRKLAQGLKKGGFESLVDTQGLIRLRDGLAK